MGKEDEIRLIAYRIWEEEGCIDRHDCEHWFKAEAIWQQNQKKSVVENTEKEVKQVVEENTKAIGKKRKTKRN
jgi:hypothetical protein